METDEGNSKENQPREDFSESSKPFQHPGGGGPVETHHPRGRNSEARAATRAADDVTAISPRGRGRSTE